MKLKIGASYSYFTPLIIFVKLPSLCKILRILLRTKRFSSSHRLIAMIICKFLASLSNFSYIIA